MDQTGAQQIDHAEIARLRRAVMEAQRALAEAQRKLAPEPMKDAALRDDEGREVRLSSLFGAGRDLLVIHNMGRSCVYCTMWADALASSHAHVLSRTALVLVSPDEPAVMREFAASRQWPFRMISMRGTSFARDMGYENEQGQVLPGVSALYRGDDGAIVRTARAEFGPGDVFCPAWHLFDLLKDGRGAWEPRYRY